MQHHLIDGSDFVFCASADESRLVIEWQVCVTGIMAEGDWGHRHLRRLSLASSNS